METLTLNVPAMYGDHHVIEVRRVLSGLPGIGEIYASSAFQIVQLEYDPEQIKPEAIKAALEEAGYLQELDVPVETGAVAYSPDGQETFFRHTTAFEQAQHVVSFAQEVQPAGRILWPCPGLGVIRKVDEEE